MTSTVTVNIGTGKDYANLNTFATWLANQDLVANDQVIDARVYEDEVVPNYTYLNVKTFDANRYCIVQPAAGMGVNELDTSGPLTYGSSGIQLTANMGAQFRVGYGVRLHGFRVLIGNNGTFTTPGLVPAPSAPTLPTDVFNSTITNCRILIQATYGAYAIDGYNNGGHMNMRDCLVINEGSAPIPIRYRCGSDLSRNTFIARGTAVGISAALQYDTNSSTTYIQDNVFVGCGAKPYNHDVDASQTATGLHCSNNFTDTAFSGTFNGFTVAANPLQSTTDYRPATSGPLIGAGSTRAQNTNDLRGLFRGTVPDVGSAMLAAAPLPNVSNATVTSVTVIGQKVKVAGTYTNSYTSVTGTISAAATPNGAVTATATVAASNGSFTVEFDNTTPGNYQAPQIIFTNQSGSGTCSGGSAFTVAVPAVPVVTISSQTKNGQTVTINGTVTNYPVSGSASLPAGATPNGAVTQSLTIQANYEDSPHNFSISFSSVPYGSYAAPTVSFTNAGGTGSATGTATTLYAPGGMTPGTAEVDLTPYTAPTYTGTPNVALGAEVTNVTLVNTSGVDQTNIPFTFGQPFKINDLSPADFLLGKYNGTDVPLQFEIKATHTDGSVRHAIISGVLPSLAASTSATISLTRASSTTVSTTPETASAIVAAGVTGSVSVVINGTTYVADVAAAISAGTTPYQAWLQGGICTDLIFHIPFKNTGDGTPHPYLTAQFGLRHYAGINKGRVDVTVEATKTYTVTSDTTYDVTVNINGSVTYTKTGLVHTPDARWRRTYDVNGSQVKHIKHNVAYLIGSKQVPNYDQTVVMQESALQAYADAVNTTTKFDPMKFGDFAPSMGGTGARNEIGLAPGGYAAYIISQDKRAKDYMIASAQAAGSWQTHYRDNSGLTPAQNGANGRPMDIIHWPYASIVGTTGDCANPNTGQNEKLPALSTATAGAPDTAHQGAFAYIPYLVTGDFYFLEELHFWCGFNTISLNPGYRNYSSGLITHEQMRGMAWDMRTHAECAFITPDNHPGKAVFQYLWKQNINYFINQYMNGGPGDNPLHINTEAGVLIYSTVNGSNTGTAPWQEDFFVSAIGHAAELGSANAATFLQYKAKFMVDRMLASGFCWISASIYQLTVRDTPTSPIYADLGTCYPKSISAALYSAYQTYGCNSQQFTDQLNAERQLPSNAYVTNQMVGYAGSSTGYPANFQPALAMSADSGLANSDLAWNLFDSRAVKETYTDTPQFAIVPRTISSTGGGGTVTVPTAPNSVLATAGNGNVTVTFTAPSSNGGAPITSYTVTASTGQTTTGVTSPILITMPNGVPATFTVHATNAAGPGPESAVSNSVTPGATGPTVPGAPVNVIATANADNTVSVSFSAPNSDGGSAITSYQVTSSAGDVFTGTSSPITATVPLDTDVSFTVRAINAAGPGTASSPSNVVHIASVPSVTSVNVIPATATVTGTGSQTFTAVVNGNYNPAQQVTWSANFGTIDSNGVFTAPAAGIVSLEVTITATSVLDNTKSGTATVTVPAAVLPPSASVSVRHFSSNVTNKFGVAVEGVYVYVTNKDTGQLAVLWKDELKTEKKYNPIVTDDEGYFEFYVEAMQCSYTAKGRGIETYTRENIFDIINDVDLTSVQQAINQLDKSKASIVDVQNLVSGKADQTALAALQTQVTAIQQQMTNVQALPPVDVQRYVTSGDGSKANPWVGWDTAITWTAGTQYDFQDGYYAYQTSPNFAKNFLKLNGRRNTVLLHQGTGNALLLDAGSDSASIVVGMEVNLIVESNAQADGGCFSRGLTHSDIKVTFRNTPNICYSDYSGVKNKVKVVHSSVGYVETVTSAQVLYTAQRQGSIDCTCNEYDVIAEGCTSFGIDVTSGKHCKFTGVSQLNGTGLYVSATAQFNDFNDLEVIHNSLKDVSCDGSYNRFRNVRSDGESVYGGLLNVIEGGMYNTIRDKGTHNVFGPLVYSINYGVFENGGINATKLRCYNAYTQNFDDDKIADVKFMVILQQLVDDVAHLKGTY